MTSPSQTTVFTAKSPSTRPSPITLLRTPRLDDGAPSEKRKEIALYFLNTFDTYTSLFDCLADDTGFYQKSIPLRHPLIFYLGHTATFFINKLTLAKLLPERIDPRMESIFAVGVDEMSWDDLNDDHYSWPSVSEVMDYRARVRATVLDLIDTLPLHMPINWDNPWWPIVMAIEHERIHLETSSVLIRQHDVARVRPQPAWRPCMATGEAPVNELITVPAGRVRIGKSYDDAYYGWDNEYGEHEADVEEFKASQYLVSNQEFLEFVEAGGYEQGRYWSDEGQSWRRFTGAKHPTFWQWRNTWHLRLMTEEVEMPWDWPVEVNYHEAKAFCEWKREQTGLPVRMPTEDEWYRLVSAAGVEEVGDDAANGNLHLDHGASPCPVTRYRHGGWFDVVGNVWQWTETPIYPFNNFKVHPLYDDFTTPTFDGQHNLIKGGSWISCGNEARLAARYAFRRHFFQHAGFRYITSEAEAAQPNAYYESDKLLTEYAEFHFGDTSFGVGNFPKALADLALEAMKGKPTQKALDLGCACGRASFELARQFSVVEGVDFSANFIRLGVEMADQGSVRYSLAEEGDLVSYHTRTLKELGLEAAAQRVSFHQGDACNLKPQFTGYDLVLAANLIDRLYRPRRFLDSIHERVNEGGLLIIASPYTWLEEHTPKDEWIGGFKKDGENYTTLDGLRDLLSDNFRLVGEPRKVPFIIRETQHKHQHTLSEVTIWERLPR
ncbi:5-histidylcysteine sulfoxide synthase [Marinobacter sp. 1_MG-2023]|uniref:5-histidylcysteine sulfoxide synthase n=1 Tax=Marinobacter sp. 1_MG-2023 TaxID=3062627 RepID=UPI0026E40FD2|nr:5-histidylcysteine sulfoxide synthase [Marinobacter sp. 1_MG-2023]MDO6822990.1 5-histidylcysteine sulfoxide synthase [Marinobacter sp. 1_MG-2023]